MRRFVGEGYGAPVAWATVAGRGRGSGGRGRGTGGSPTEAPPTAVLEGDHGLSCLFAIPAAATSAAAVAPTPSSSLSSASSLRFGLGAAQCSLSHSSPMLTSQAAIASSLQRRAFASTGMSLAYKQRGRSRGRGRGGREPAAGDWTCPCGTTNGFSRRECFKCQAPAPPLPLGQSRPKLPGEDPHDWACPCGKMNYRGGVSCHKCGMPKPVPPPAEGAPSPMWQCTRCRNITRAGRKFCPRCGAPKTAFGEDYDNQAAIQQQQARVMREGSSPAADPSDPYSGSYGQSSTRSDGGQAY